MRLFQVLLHIVEEMLQVLLKPPGHLIRRNHRNVGKPHPQVIQRQVILARPKHAILLVTLPASHLHATQSAIGDKVGLAFALPLRICRKIRARAFLAGLQRGAIFASAGHPILRVRVAAHVAPSGRRARERGSIKGSFSAQIDDEEEEKSERRHAL